MSSGFMARDNQNRYKGFYEYAKVKRIDVGKTVRLEVVVDGIVPTGSGFSRSAALVSLLLSP
ncbi:Mevalonate/galactokinase family protein [Perilla frutescens var. frutescens]|nr:Mevalonate/galactokinase family protein [Perilla frutescens var. frutescens]